MNTLVIFALAIAVVGATPLFTGEVVKQELRLQKKENLVQEAKKLGLTTLVDLAAKAGLADTLAHGGPFTMFGPTDEAFAALPEEVLNALMSNMTLLRQALSYHVHMGKFESKMIKNELKVSTLLKPAEIRLNTYDKNMLVTAEGSPIIKADQMASNGVIHVLSRVMYPIPMGDVVDVVSMNPDFSTLLTAVETAGIAATLKGDALTVFAPTNAAFAKIPAEDLQKLLANKTALTNVLTYHVVASTVWSAALKDGAMVPTANGKDITVHINDNGDVMINDSKVIMADAAVSNGVIHVIDTVLMPPMY